MARRIMNANGNPGVFNPHNEEHAEIESCSESPPCVPLKPQPDEALAVLKSYDPPPSHYAADGMEPWDVVVAFELGYFTGSVIKYICRAGKKDGESRVKDLKKARNFLSKAIELEEKRGS